MQAAPGAGAAAEAAACNGTPERAIRENAYPKSDLEFAGEQVAALSATVIEWCAGRPAYARRSAGC